MDAITNQMILRLEAERDRLREEVERMNRTLGMCYQVQERMTAALREIDQIVKIHPDLLIPRDYNMSEIEIARTQKAILAVGDIAAAALKMEGGGKE